MVNIGYPACAISFAHRQLGPVPKYVDALLQGKTILNHLTDISNSTAELRQLDISIRSNVSSVTQMKVFSSILGLFPSHLFLEHVHRTLPTESPANQYLKHRPRRTSGRFDCATIQL